MLGAGLENALVISYPLCSRDPAYALNIGTATDYWLSVGDTGGSAREECLIHLPCGSGRLVSMRRLVNEFSFIRGNFLILLASWSLMSLAAAIPDTYYSLYVLALGGTELVIGAIGFASSLTLGLVQLPGGYLADKHGRRWLVVTMTFSVAVTYLIYALAPSWHLLLVAGVLQSLCLIYQPALGAITADSIPSEKRGIGFSIQTMLPDVARLLGPTTAGVLYLRFGLVPAVRIGYATAFILFLIAAVSRVGLKETLKETVDRPNISSFLSSYPEAIRESVRVWRLLPKAMFNLFLVSSLLQFFTSMCSPYLVVYATKILSISGFGWALVTVALIASRILSALPAGKVIDRFGRRKPLIVSPLLLLPSIMLFVYGDFHKLLVSALLMAIGQSTFWIAERSLQADLVARQHRGKVMACMHFVSFVLVALGQMLGGVLYSYVSPRAPFIAFAASTIPLATMASLLVYDPRKREE